MDPSPRPLTRPPDADDVPAIVRVGRAAWPPTYAFAGPEYVAHGLATWWSTGSIKESLATTEYRVVELDGEVVGVGNLDLRPAVPVIWKLYLLPESQGRGVGAALLQSLVDAVPDDRDRVALEYADGNDRAAAFYTRHGFVEVRRESPEQPGWPDLVWVERRLR
jgi:GNAT superfamily N-acetyltransferase